MTLPKKANTPEARNNNQGRLGKGIKKSCMSVKCVCTFDFHTPNGRLKQLGTFALFSLSSAAGIPITSLILIDISSRMDTRQTTMIFTISSTTMIESWAHCQRLRETFADKLSPLNSVGNMKKVFNGSVLDIVRPQPEADKTGLRRAGSKLSSKVRAPKDVTISPGPPLMQSPIIPPLRKGSQDSVITSNRIPVDSAHIPFDLILIPPGARSPPKSPKREYHFHLPPPKVTEKAEPPIQFSFVDLGKVDEILNRAEPRVPESLLHAIHQLNSS
jgi:hypothetical protein